MNDNDSRDQDITAVAYHEAGHAIAAVLCGVGWTEVRVDDNDDYYRSNGEVTGRTTPVEEHHDDTSPANLAFIAWAGSWAKARYLSADNPRRLLPALLEAAYTDHVKVAAYLADPDNAPHETDVQWARALDSAWSHVEALAQQLSDERVVRTPLHPDWSG